MGDKEHDFNTIHKADIYNVERYEDTQVFGEGKHNVKYKFKLDIPAGVEYQIIVEAKVQVKEVEG